MGGARGLREVPDSSFFVFHVTEKHYFLISARDKRLAVILSYPPEVVPNKAMQCLVFKRAQTKVLKDQIVHNITMRTHINYLVE